MEKTRVDSSAESEDIGVVHPCSADHWFAERPGKGSCTGQAKLPALGQNSGRTTLAESHCAVWSIGMLGTQLHGMPWTECLCGVGKYPGWLDFAIAVQ